MKRHWWMLLAAGVAGLVGLGAYKVYRQSWACMRRAWKSFEHGKAEPPHSDKRESCFNEALRLFQEAADRDPNGPFEKALKEYPDVMLVGVDYNLDNQEKAQAQTAAVLQANPDLKGVFGTNLFSAQGAYRAVVAAGLTGAVKVASWDAGQDQINALQAGQIDFTLAQKPFEIGQLAVEWGYKYLTQNAQVPKVIRPGFFIITKENLSTPEAQASIYK